MSLIQFRTVAETGLDLYVALTRETLWQPVWPGDDQLRREFEHWPTEIQKAVTIVYDGSEPVGRLILPQFEDFLTVRDLGLRPYEGLPDRVGRALLDYAKQRRVRYLRLVVHEPYWQQLGALGCTEQKRRITMRLDLKRRPFLGAPEGGSASAAANARSQDSAVPARCVAQSDVRPLGELLYAAYRRTIDDEGEDLPQWTSHAHDVLRGQYGTFIPDASFATPEVPPFQSATLVIESAPGHAVLGQVVTRQSFTNRGLARRLIGCSLDALQSRHYEDCFLEVTLANENAVHLYRALGFVELGPQIVYGLQTLA